MRKWTTISIALVLSLILIFAACAAPAPTPTPTPAPAPTPKPTPTPKPPPASVSPAEFFKEKTVILIVNSKPGGGTDYISRLVASYWTTVTGGSMVIKNEPGGGGLAALNLVYGAKPDGLTIGIGTLLSHVVQPALIGAKGVKFDPRKFGYIGGGALSPKTFVIGKKVNAESMADLQKMKDLRFVTTGAATGNALGMVLICDLFGLEGAKVVPGLKTADMGLALARGEAHGAVDNSASSLDFIKKEYAKAALAVFAKERSKWFPDTPTVREQTWEQLSQEQQNLLGYMEGNDGTKTFFVTPAIPQDRLQFMQDAFAKVIQDKGFLRQVKLRWVIWQSAPHGKDFPALVAGLLNVPKETVEGLNTVMDKWIVR